MAHPIVDERYLHSGCKVRTMENAVLSVGRIIEITDTYITVRNIPELPSIIHFNMKVKLSILNDKLGYKTLIGTVFTSTTKMLKLTEVKEVDEFEKRSYFRLNVSLRGMIRPLNDTAPANPEQEEPESIDVEIENVSLSGVLFTCPTKLKMNDRIAVTLFTPNGKLEFPASVRRIMPDQLTSVQHYGCAFEPYPERLGDALWQYMLQKEREDIRRAKGEWS